VFGILHDVRGEGVEGEEICDLGLLLPVLACFSLADDVSIDDLLSWQEEVLHLFVSKVEFNYEFPASPHRYYSPSFSSLATPKISFLFMGRSSSVIYSGRLYSFLTIAIVWLGPNAENLTSISFLGSRER
jgi:hypothetical protein